MGMSFWTYLHELSYIGMMFWTYLYALGYIGMTFWTYLRALGYIGMTSGRIYMHLVIETAPINYWDPLFTIIDTIKQENVTA